MTKNKLAVMYADYLVTARRKSHNTALAYQRAATDFLDWLALSGKDIDHASPIDVAAYIQMLRDREQAHATLVARKSAVVGFYMYALRMLTKDDPREDGPPTGGSGRGLAEPHQIAQD